MIPTASRFGLALLRFALACRCVSALFAASLIVWSGFVCDVQAATAKPHTNKLAPELRTPEVDAALRELLLKAMNEQDLKFHDKYDAQAWMMAMSSRLQPYIADEKERIKLLTLIRREALLAGLKPELVLALIEVESRFDRFAISRVGAQGMMQVMPFWKNEIGRADDNLTITTTNLRYGCTILKYYLDKEKGSVRSALADYNGSSVYGDYPDLVFRAYKRKWRGGEV